MRIAQVIDGLHGGGAERVCINLANAWVERGRQVTIQTVSQKSAAPAYSIDPRVKLSDVGWRRGARPEELNAAAIAPVIRGLHHAGCSDQLTEQITLLALIRYAILREKPEVVVSHIDVTNLRVLAAMYETKIPVIVCEHTDTSQISLGPWEAVRTGLYRRAHAVVASHPISTERFKRSGIKAIAIPNPLVAPSPLRHERSGNRRSLVALTRLSLEKRPELFVRAFARIAGDFPDWDFGVYGEGPMSASVSNLIDDLAPGRIQLHGFTTTPYEILKNADLFVSTSWVEGFGNSIWEALACGVPVVATEAGAPVRSLVRDGIDGLIVKEGSIKALASALASLMGDHQKREACAARAPEVVARFSLEASLEAWDRLLNAVTLGKSLRKDNVERVDEKMR